ncbi:MAG: hypothetical protein ACE37J_07375 [Pikeienuella sp.]|uniref:hypothetical protein n=1 Tax=Pikeienuella sp. TaxID=2831957 RepID=UPI0039199FEF
MEPAPRDPSEAPLVLEFGETAIRLLRAADGEPLGAVALDDPDFAAAAAALGADAAALTGRSPAPVTLWLPPARVLAVVAEGGGAEEAERALEAASPAPLAELVVTFAGSENCAAAAAERSVVAEAAEYARLWGFAPLRVSTNPEARPELAAFAGGPDFLRAPAEPAPEVSPPPVQAAEPIAPAPARRLRVRGAALLAGLVGLAAVAALWLAPQERDDGPFAAPPPSPPALSTPALDAGAAAAAAMPPAPSSSAPGAPREPSRSAAPPALVALAEPPAPPLAPEDPTSPAAPSPAPEAAAPPPAPHAPAAPEPTAEEPPAPKPPPEAALAAAEEAAAPEVAAEEETPGPGAVESAPRPGARPDHPADAVGRALALAPAPRARPRGLAPRRQPAAQPQAETARAAPSGAIDDEEGEEAGIAAAPRRSAPTGSGVAAAATLRDAIRLDDMAMIGVFGAADARRALLRMPDGRVHRVTSGSVVEGWVVSRIEAGSMRLTRGGEARTLDLTQ